MSVEDLKRAMTTLSPGEQDQVTAFLFHLRHKGDADYQLELERRLGDKDPAHWLRPEQFEKQLDKN